MLDAYARRPTPVPNEADAESVHLTSESGSGIGRPPNEAALKADLPRARRSVVLGTHNHSVLTAASLKQTDEEAAGVGFGCWDMYTCMRDARAIPSTALLLAGQPPASGSDHRAAPLRCRLLQRARTARASEVSHMHMHMHMHTTYAYPYAHMHSC